MHSTQNVGLSKKCDTNYLDKHTLSSRSVRRKSNERRMHEAPPQRMMARLLRVVGEVLYSSFGSTDPHAVASLYSSGASFCPLGSDLHLDFPHHILTVHSYR